jgi:histidyl-tRNA synthetase
MKESVVDARLFLLLIVSVLYRAIALAAIRARGLSAEIYPDVVKLKKQFNYADKKNIPYVLMIGPEEMAQHKVRLKNMKTGEQKLLSLTESLDVLQAG